MPSLAGLTSQPQLPDAPLPPSSLAAVVVGNILVSSVFYDRTRAPLKDIGNLRAGSNIGVAVISRPEEPETQRPNSRSCMSICMCVRAFCSSQSPSPFLFSVPHPLFLPSPRSRTSFLSTSGHRSSGNQNHTGCARPDDQSNPPMRKPTLHLPDSRRTVASPPVRASVLTRLSSHIPGKNCTTYVYIVASQPAPRTFPTSHPYPAPLRRPAGSGEPASAM